MKKIFLIFLVFLLLPSCEKEQLVVGDNVAEITLNSPPPGVVDVITLIDILKIKVSDMIAEGEIGRGPGQSILSQLKSIEKKLNQGKIDEALEKLDELITHLEGMAADGTIDTNVFEDLTSDVESITCETEPFDGDDDGWLCNEDCNDTNPDIHPEAEEICDGIDNNCDGQIDEGVLIIYYLDADEDSYGDASATQVACSAPPGYVLDGTDCDDTNPDIHPDAQEIADNDVDDDCDGLTDCEDPDIVCSGPGGGVVDADGNQYNTVVIGNQEWMAENLRTTKYANGENIPNVTSNSQWTNLIAGGFCWYNNDKTTYEVPYGALYNWYAVDDSRGLCPTGWHEPSESEWRELANYLGGFEVAGGKMKTTGTIEAGTGLWRDPNVDATNVSGFTGVPAGLRIGFGTSGGYHFNGQFGLFWSSTVSSGNRSWYYTLNYSSRQLYKNYYDWNRGYSVRCVKD